MQLQQQYDTYLWGFYKVSGAKYPKNYYFGLFLAISGYLEFCEWAKTLSEYAILLHQ